MDKVCQQLPPEEVYKQFGRASKLLLHPKNVPHIILMEKEDTINREGEQQNRRDDNITLCELTKDLDPHEKLEKSINTVFSTNIEHMVKKVNDADSKSSEESINRHRNDRPTEHKVQWTDGNKRTYPSNYSEESLNRLGDVDSGTVFPYEGEEGYLQRTLKMDHQKLQSDKGEKSLICCNTLKRNLQCVNSESNIQKRDELGEEEYRQKSINHMHQTQYSQCVKENPKTMIATLCELQCEISEKSIILPKELRCDTCYQTVPNNSVVEWTDEINNVDLQQGWGKAVSFITNTSNKLCLSSVLRSLTQIPVVAGRDKTKENSSIKQNGLDSVNCVSDSSFTFFL